MEEDGLDCAEGRVVLDPPLGCEADVASEEVVDVEKELVCTHLREDLSKLACQLPQALVGGGRGGGREKDIRRSKETLVKCMLISLVISWS